MKKIGSFISNKAITKRSTVDEKTVFYVFGRIIGEEYGKQGLKNVIAESFRDKKIFIRTLGQNWPNEIWLNKAFLLKRINGELGSEEIIDLAMSN